MEFLKSLDKLPLKLVNVAGSYFYNKIFLNVIRKALIYNYNIIYLSMLLAQCLNTITEENEDTFKYFTETPDFINILKTIASGQISIVNEWENNGILLKLLSSSILYNIKTIIPISMDELYSIIFNAISSSLEYKTSESIKEVISLAEKMVNMILKI